MRAPLTHDHRSVISGLTAAGPLCARIQDQAFTGETGVGFRRQRLRQVRSKLLVVWDGATIHRCRAVKDDLAGGAAARLHLERLPGYAPERNADQGIWNLLKQQQLKNRCCHDQAELRGELRQAIRRLQRRPDLITACFRQCGCLPYSISYP